MNVSDWFAVGHQSSRASTSCHVTVRGWVAGLTYKVISRADPDTLGQLPSLSVIMPAPGVQLYLRYQGLGCLHSPTEPDCSEGCRPDHTCGERMSTICYSVWLGSL